MAALAATDHLQKLIFELEIGARDDAPPLQERVSGFCRARLPSVLSACLAEFARDDTVFAFDRLELNLGSISIGALEDELAHRLALALRDALSRRLPEARYARPVAQVVADGRPEDSPFAAIGTFLQRGALPSGWHAAPAGRLDETLMAMLREHPAEILALLRTLGRKAAVRSRLARQFSEPAIHALTQLLAPTHADFVIDFAREVVRIHASQPLLNLNTAAFGKLLWECILTHLFLEAGTQFNAVAFIGGTIRQLAAWHRIAVAALLERVASDLRALSPGFCMHYSLGMVLELLQAERHPQVHAPAPGWGDPDTLDLRPAEGGMSLSRRRLRALAAFLDRGMLPWSAGDIATHGIDAMVGALLDEVPAETLALVRRVGQQDAVRQRLASQLQDPAIERLVELLEPSHARSVLSHAREMRRMQRHAAPVRADGRAFRAAVWQFVLTYLLVERGSQFNTREFVKSMTVQMAARYGLAYGELLLRLVAAIRVTTARAAAGDPLGRLLLLLSDEVQVGRSAPLLPQRGSLIRDAFARAYTELDLLAHWLRWGGPPAWSRASGGQLDILVQRLLRHAPDELTDLLARLGRRQDVATYLAEHLRDATLERLVNLSASRHRQASWDLALALQQARRTSAPSASARIVGQLTPVAASEASGSAHVVGSADAGLAAAGQSPPSDELALLLEYGIWPAGIPALADASLVQWLRDISDVQLEQALRDSSPAPHVARRIVRQLPPTLFPRAMHLLAGADASRLLGFQEALRVLAERGELGAGAEDAFAVQVREYVLAHLLAKADQPFALPDLVRSVVGAIAVRYDAGYGRLLAALSERTVDGGLRSVYAALYRERSAERATENAGEAASTRASGAAPVTLSPPDAVIAFLSSGVVSPQGAPLLSAASRQWFTEALDRHRNQLLPALKAIADRPDVIGRLLHYVAPAELAQLIEVLVPAHAQFVLTYLLAGARLESDRGLVSGQRRRVTALHWQAVLTLLLDAHARSFSREAFVAQASSRVAQRLNLPLLGYRARLLLAAREASAADGRYVELVEMLSAKQDGEAASTATPGAAASGLHYATPRELPGRPASPPASPAHSDLLASTRHFLRFGSLPTGSAVDTLDALAERLPRAFQNRPAAFRRLFRKAYESDLERLRIAHAFPPALFAQLLRLLLPEQHRSAALSAEALGQALAALMPGAEPGMLRAAAAADLLRSVNEQRGRHFELAQYLRGAVRRIADEHDIEPLALLEKIHAVVGRATTSHGGHVLRAIDRLQRQLDLPVLRAFVTERERPPASPWLHPARRREHEELPGGEAFYIANAGLVLLWPFLTRYFGMLGLLEQSAFADEQQRSRAVYLLEHLATGKAEAPEPALLLNKILCGMDSAVPPESAPVLTEQERQASEELLYAVTQNWTKLRNTSIAGLRDSFLIREGRLLRKDDAWALTVEIKAHDVLLDTLPWRLSTIRLPWMQCVLYVSWR